MKNLRLPIQSEQSIDISEISRDFLGLIIAYKNNKAIGYIQFYDTSWFLSNNIDWECSASFKGDTLLKLVTMLIKKNLCTHFKVIEFADENS